MRRAEQKVEVKEGIEAGVRQSGLSSLRIRESEKFAVDYMGQITAGAPLTDRVNRSVLTKRRVTSRQGGIKILVFGLGATVEDGTLGQDPIRRGTIADI